MELKIPYEEWSALPEHYERLYEEALSAAGRAYAPYSGFYVGAALLLDNGMVVSGGNQENVAYPSGMCAERTALFYANSQYCNAAVKALLIVALQDGKVVDSPVFPCGSCRQAIAETVKRFGDFDVIMTGAIKTVSVKASCLLPFSFSF